MLVSYILLNLFLATILASFDEVYKDEKPALIDIKNNNFNEVWSNFDPKASG